MLMFSWIRRRATYANVAMTVALVFAMSGGAFAAGKFLITSTKQISPKVLASLKGAKGANGAPGAAGAAGPAGPQGPQGAAGAKGEKGADGKEGLQGKEGKEGAEGPEGLPGPSCNPSGECLLPPGATETGTWQFQENEGVGSYPVNISFQLRLSSAPKPVFVSPAQSGTAGAVSGCPGTAALPKAAVGNLCVYESEIFNIEEEEFKGGADPTSGGSIVFSVAAPENAKTASGHGSWAVTR
jgi:hypothetical protein